MKNRNIASRRTAALRRHDRITQKKRARAITMSEGALRGQIGRLVLLSALTAVLLVTSWNFARATEIQRVVSDAGIEAWLVEDHTVPIIAMDFSFSGGSAQDADGKEGTVSLLTSMLDEGAGDLDSNAFQSAIEDNAIKMGFDASMDRFYGSIRTLTPTQDMAFDLLAKALQKPRFDTEPFERMRAYWLTKVRSELRDPNAIALACLFR